MDNTRYSAELIGRRGNIRPVGSIAYSPIYTTPTPAARGGEWQVQFAHKGNWLTAGKAEQGRTAEEGRRMGALPGYRVLEGRALRAWQRG